MRSDRRLTISEMVDKIDLSFYVIKSILIEIWRKCAQYRVDVFSIVSLWITIVDPQKILEKPRKHCVQNSGDVFSVTSLWVTFVDLRRILDKTQDKLSTVSCCCLLSYLLVSHHCWPLENPWDPQSCLRTELIQGWRPCEEKVNDLEEEKCSAI